MNLRLFKIFSTTVLVFAGIINAVAQNGGGIGSAFEGEVLTYEGRASKLKIGISVADLTFESERVKGTDNLLIKSEAVSKGSLLRLFKYSFLQRYESVVDINGFNILKTTKHDVQKERVRDSEAVFNYPEKRVTYVETDPKDQNRPPRRIASEIEKPLFDMVSSIYYVRLAPLAVGKTLDLAVSDSGLIFRVPVTVSRREKVDSVVGKVWCFRLEPEIFGRDRLIEQKGKMIVWVTDDERRIPVKAQVTASFGKVDIKLKSYRKTVRGASDAKP